ncbi:unnamed protein product [Phytomonas sp. EM1]|nr:unnamed protein product [Phytomonas sp. EM1]|eukprot:CCW65064.1 unnamed protein product [Phytomonas sp. isolate EM1]
MPDVTCNIPLRNIHASPKEKSGFCGRCSLVSGYMLPCVACCIILTFVVGHMAFFILLMTHYPDVLHIILSVLFMLIDLLLEGIALWSFVQVIRTSPGYVLPTPWRDPPRYEPRRWGRPRPSTAQNDHAQHNGQDNPHSQDQPNTYNPNSNPNPSNPPSHNPIKVSDSVKDDHDGTGVVALSFSESSRPTMSEGEGGGGTPPPRFSSSLPPLVGVQGEVTVSILDYRTGALRYCARCQLYMPDFAHHCQICEHCVYRMDHHCPWVNNCIGRNNYKLFLIFLFYLWTSWLLEAGEVAIGMFVIDHDKHMDRIWCYALLVLSAILGLSFLMFYTQHRIGVRRGRSTMDSAIRRRKKHAAKRVHTLNSLPPNAAQCDEESEWKEARIAEFKHALFGEEKRFWRRWLPFPIRTDDNANELL